jgi:hypothetical protein
MMQLAWDMTGAGLGGGCLLSVGGAILLGGVFTALTVVAFLKHRGHPKAVKELLVSYAVGAASIALMVLAEPLTRALDTMLLP